MLIRKLGRLLGLTLMLVALAAGVAGVAAGGAGAPAVGDQTSLEYDWA
ncbi:hypothetical protein ABGB16_04060 [Micromonospora sp. B11E3]